MTPVERSGSTVPALILGGHLTGLGVLRLLAARGVPALVAGVNPADMVVHSRWYRPAPAGLREHADAADLAAYLERLRISSAVLLPCGDGWTRAVAGLPESIRSRFPASVPDRSTVERFVDKDRFSELMVSLDMARPWSVTLTSVDDLAGVTDDEIAGGFLKPRDSQRFSARFEGKGFWPVDRADARRLLDDALEAGVGLLLQEWIPGDASHNLHIDAFVDRQGAIAGFMARRKIRRQPWLLGNTASAVTIPLSDVPEPVAATRRIIEAVGYRGVFSAEFKFDARDGRYKILEVNARPFWYVTHAAEAGLDVAWLSYLDALERPVPKALTYRSGLYGLFEINDAVALSYAWRSGSRPVGPILRPWLLGHRALFWWRDPGPGVFELGSHLGRRAARLLGRSRPRITSSHRQAEDLPGSNEH